MSDPISQNKAHPQVQILEMGPMRSLVRVGSEDAALTLIPREAGVYDIKGERGWSRVHVARTAKGTWWIHHDGQVFEFHIPRHGLEESNATKEASGDIRAPTPAKVAAVLVTTGAEVKIDDPVVVLESMKTEQTLTAEVSGTVTQIAVEEGQQVTMDELLVVIEPTAPAGAE